MADLGPLLFERSPGAVLVLSRDGQVLVLNREAQRLLGVEAERVVGRPVLAWVLPDDRERVKQAFLRVLSGQEREWIARFARGDGIPRAQWVRAVPVEEGGRVAQIVMFTRDVTDAGAGRPEGRQLQALLEHLPGQFVAVLDAAGLIRYSAGISRTHFRDEVGSIGQPFGHLLEPSEDNHLLCERMLLELLKGNEWGGTQWHARADGSSFPVLVLATPYRDPRSGRALGALVVGRDVSAERQWRVRAERAERLAAVGRLVAGVAARVADGVARLERALGPAPAGAGEAVQREAAALASLALAVQRLAGTSWQGRPDWLSPGAEVERAIAAAKARSGARHVRFECHLAEELPRLQADGEQLAALLAALLDNAVESLAPDGAEVVRVSCAPSADGERIRIQVTDSGVGIAGEDLHRAAEPFFTTKPGHAGLGLPLASAIAAGHGGTLELDSGGKGAGAVVTVEIPREEPGMTVRFRPVPIALRASRSVLVVDDEPTVRLSIRRFLERVGYEVREAWSGRSALAQITVGTPPELVVTDLRMGDGSGAWLLEQLSRDFPDLLRRTVILTGAIEEDELDQLTRQTGCPLLRKPPEMAQLLDALDEVASRD